MTINCDQSLRTSYLILKLSFFKLKQHPWDFLESDAAFTLNDFDDQERNSTFVKTDFQVWKLKFHPCSLKQAFYPLHKPISRIAWPWQHKHTFIQASFRYLAVKPACVNTAWALPFAALLECILHAPPKWSSKKLKGRKLRSQVVKGG